MLTELKLANFRIFDDAVTVRFRPITVLLGRNGSGKSTIIEFLLLLQQSQEPPKTDYLTPEGDLVNLGSFLELRNSGTRKRTLQFELTMARLPILPGPPGVDPRAFAEAVLGQVLYGVEAVVPYGGNRGKGSVSYAASAGTDGETLRRVDYRVEDDFQFGDYPRVPEGVHDILDYDSTEEVTEELAEELADRIGEQKMLMLEVMEQQELINAVHYEVDARRHLGTGRMAAPRVILDTPPPMNSVGRSGQYTLHHLQRIVAEKGERYAFLRPHLQAAAGIGEVEFKALTRAGQISQGFARNPATGAAAQLADLGWGARQCLPILVQGAIMPANTTLMVEQPEAQLHPAAQREMGGYFADLWNQRQVGSIIETHSDNILRRLQQAVASGELAPHDISVAYCTVDASNPGRPMVKNLDINRNGTLAAGLPPDFFG